MQYKGAGRPRRETERRSHETPKQYLRRIALRTDQVYEAEQEYALRMKDHTADEEETVNNIIADLL